VRAPPGSGDPSSAACHCHSNHACVVTNLFDRIYAARRGVETFYEVAARESAVSLATLARARCRSPCGLLERLVAIDTQNPPGREVEAAALLASNSKRSASPPKFDWLQTAAPMSSAASTAATALFRFQLPYGHGPRRRHWTSDRFV
jgi:hypothetical protein